MIVLIEILVEILQGIGSLFSSSRSDVDRIESQIERREHRNGRDRLKRSEMDRLRDLLKTLDGQAVRPTAGPNSLYEAGRVGTASGGRPVRRVARQEAWFESGAERTDEPTAEERTTRRVRTGAAQDRMSQPPQAARQIRAALQDPGSLRTAILLREVLDPPVSRRPRKR